MLMTRPTAKSPLKSTGHILPLGLAPVLVVPQIEPLFRPVSGTRFYRFPSLPQLRTSGLADLGKKPILNYEIMNFRRVVLAEA